MAIVGAGVVGCSIAARLSLDDLSVAVLERHHDVAEETSKSNTGITDSGWECRPSSLEADLVTDSSRRWEDLSERLDIPFKRCGGLSLARSETEAKRLEEIVGAANENGVRVRRLSGDEARRIAPYITESVVAAVEAPDEGTIDPIRLTLGYAELAALNGVRFHFNAPVLGARVDGERVREIHTPGFVVRPRFVINAAGLGADVVSRLLGAEEFQIWPRRGEYLLLDREIGKEVTRIVTQPPSEQTRGIMVVPATHGSLLLGPTAQDVEDKGDRSTHSEVLDHVFSECRRLLPGLRREHVIKSFAGLRPASDRTYRIEQSATTKNLIQACAIRSTGISGSPAIADYVREILVEAGLRAPPRRHAVDRVTRLPRLAENLDCEKLAREPLGRIVVCVCEKVTALEVHNAFRSPVPAKSITGVAKRTRATWGRCQGSACLSGVAFIASLYLPTEAWRVPIGESDATLGVVESAHA